MESHDPLIGKELGTCVLDHVVGSGGMGKVYLAHQTRPIRDVAVKVLHSGAGLYTDAHKGFLERFRREANVIARLDHINILPIYGYDEQDGLAYLVMPYLTGGSLRTLLMERGKLSPQEAFKYIEQAGAALQYAHEHQIVHRDVKPANMLFHADGRLVLVDFGIARIARDNNVSGLTDTSITMAGQFLGSAEYMAPEMVQGRNVDYRADLYELGIVLFQMLTGRVPFQGMTVLTIAAMHINETPPSLTLLEPSIPRALDAVVQKVLSKRPEDRYNSAAEFVAAVRAALGTISLFSQDLNTYPVSQPLISMQPDSQNNSFLQASQGAPYHFETVDSAGSSASTPYENSEHVSNERIAYILAPTNTPPAPQNTSFLPLTNNLQGNPASMHLVPGNESTPYNVVQSSALIDKSYNDRVLRKQKKPHTALNWILVLCTILVLGTVGVIFAPSMAASISRLNTTPTATPLVTATATATATTTVTPAEQAQAVIQLFYDDINKADFTDAYNQLSKAYQMKQTYDNFRAGYAHTRKDIVTYSSTAALGNWSYQCNVKIEATEIDDAGATSTKTYTGYYIVGPDSNALKILPGTFMQQNT